MLVDAITVTFWFHVTAGVVLLNSKKSKEINPFISAGAEAATATREQLGGVPSEFERAGHQ